MSANIVYAILVTSLATFLSRFLGALTSQGIKETSKLFKWFNCLAYATLAALIARTIIFPAGVLIDASYASRFIVVFLSLFRRDFRRNFSFKSFLADFHADIIIYFMEGK